MLCIIRTYQAIQNTKTKLLYRISEGWLLIQFLATFLGALNVISSGMHFGWTSPSLPKLQSNDSAIPITNGEGSTIAAIMLLGTLTGSFTTSNIIDRIGRKTTILITTFPMLISWMMLAFARSFIELLVARYIAGIADGLTFCATNMYISEIAHPKYRGFLGSAIGISYIFGNLLINIIGSRLSITTTAFLCSALPAILLLTFCWMPESPYYLLMKDNIDEANHSLRIFNGNSNYENDLDRISKGLADQKANSGSWFDLIKVASNRKAICMVMILRTVQQGSGSTAILFYIQSIFLDLNSVIAAEHSASVYLGIQLLTSVLFSLFVDKAGRKPLLAVSMGGSGVALFVVAFYYYFKHHTNLDVSEFTLIPFIALIIYVFMFGIALQTIPILMTAELFPPGVKAYGVSVSDMYFAVTAAVVSKYFQITKDEFGLEVPFFTFGSLCILGNILGALFLFETKGKTLEDIQLRLSGARY